MSTYRTRTAFLFKLTACSIAIILIAASTAMAMVALNGSNFDRNWLFAPVLMLVVIAAFFLTAKALTDNWRGALWLAVACSLLPLTVHPFRAIGLFIAPVLLFHTIKAWQEG
jgi:hypothetical protein